MASRLASTELRSTPQLVLSFQHLTLMLQSLAKSAMSQAVIWFELNRLPKFSDCCRCFACMPEGNSKVVMDFGIGWLSRERILKRLNCLPSIPFFGKSNA
jgi:hypothetical protein